MALALQSQTSPFWRPWEFGQSYARRFLDAFPKTSALPISSMPPYTRGRMRRRRIVRRRANRLRRGGRRMRRPRKVQKKSSVVTRIKRANRGFRNVMRLARNANNVRYVYDIFKVTPLSMSSTADTLVYNSCRVSDFKNVDSQLVAAASSTDTYGYTEYRVAKAFVKITPRNPNYARNASVLNINPGNHPWIGAWPLSHFSDLPTTAPTQRQVSLSNSVKRISFFKTKATHMPINALMEQLVTIADGEATSEIVSVPTQRMPFIEYKAQPLENPKLMPSAVYAPKAADANSILNWDIEYHVIFCLRQARNDVTEF